MSRGVCVESVVAFLRACLEGSNLMPVLTPLEFSLVARPTNTSDAAANAALQFFCRSAPLLAAYGVLSGNLAAAGAGAGLGIACGLPILFPTPPPDTGSVPFVGGQDSVSYRVRVQLLNHNTDCTVANNIDREDIVQGPLNIIRSYLRDVKYDCRSSTSQLFAGGYTNFRGDPTIVGNYSPDVGGYYAMSVTRVDGLPDVGGNPPFVPSPLPPGYEIPPGYPDSPFLPGIDVTVPVYRNPDGTDPPDRWIPFRIPNLPLPVIIPIAPSFNPSATIPINVPVRLNAQGTATFEPQFNFQIDPDGNIRTPPDLLCPCEVEPEPVGSLSPVVTVPYEIPYYECGMAVGSFKLATLEVVEDSIPDGLSEKLLSSANLAEVACEAMNPDQEDPSFLYSGVFQGVLVAPWFSPSLPDYLVSVELRIVEFSSGDFREITAFPGAGQYKFGSIEYCLADSLASTTPNFVWDRKTYLRLPMRIKPGRLRVLLRSGVSFEIWDTGERLLR